MSMQSLVNMTLTDTQIAAVDAALNTLETELAVLVSLSPEEKRRIRKMGDKSESFSRQALQVISQSPALIPSKVGVDDAIADLKLLDQLRPRLTRLMRLCERGSDTDAALGHDIMAVSLQAYGLMKLIGNGEGMETLKRDLSSHFARSRRKPVEEAAQPERKAA